MTSAALPIGGWHTRCFRGAVILIARRAALALPPRRRCAKLGVALGQRAGCRVDARVTDPINTASATARLSALTLLRVSRRRAQLARLQPDLLIGCLAGVDLLAR